MGRVLHEMGWQRSDYIISTKIFFGTGRKELNSRGLSRKHLIEGLGYSLKRLGLEYGKSGDVVIRRIWGGVS